MTEAPPSSPGIPLPLDEDDDDVAWALQTAAVQWKRLAYAEAVVWLRRAVFSAAESGSAARAAQLATIASELSESMRHQAAGDEPVAPSVPPTPDRSESSPPSEPSGEISIEIDVSFGLTPAPPPASSMPPAAELSGSQHDDPGRLAFHALLPHEVPSIPPDDGADVLDIEAMSRRLSEPAARSSRPRSTPRPGAVKPDAAGEHSSVLPAPKQPDSAAVPPSEASTKSALPRPPPSRLVGTPPPRAAVRPPAPVEVDPASTAPSVRAEPKLARAAAEPSTSPSAGPTSADRGRALGSSGVPRPSSMQAAAEPSLSPTIEVTLVATEPEEPSPPAPSSFPAPIGAPTVSSAAPADGSPPTAEAATPEAPSAQVGVRSDVAPPTLLAAQVEARPTPPAAPKPAVAVATKQRVDQPSQVEAEAAPTPATVGGIELADVPGLEDLPDQVQAELARQAHLATLGVGDEVSELGAALVLRGSLAIMAVGSESAGVYAEAGELVFTQGTVDDGIALRVVAGEDSTLVAVWASAVLRPAMANCPWVDEELRIVADRFLALAGAATGELGNRFDDSLRFLVTARSRVRSLLPGEAMVDAGKPLDGMCIVGAGQIELLQQPSDPASVERVLGPGEFLFPSAVLSGGIAPQAARAGAGGALLLVVSTPDVLELVMMVPQLLELLSGP